jgi:small-conductance mechanosensitive channel
MNIFHFLDQSLAWFYLLLGILLYLIFRLLHYSSNKYFSNKLNQYFKGMFYFIEVSSWFVYLFEGIHFFATKNIVLTVIIFIVLIFALIWFCLHIARDFLAGLILKIENEFKPGELIEFEGISGRIIQISGRLLELEDDSARKISIPFHQFFVKRYFHTSTSGYSYKENFIFKIKNTENPNELINEICSYIKKLPWTNINFEPEVRIESKDESATYIKVIASLFNEKHKENFRLKLRNRFE